MIDVRFSTALQIVLSLTVASEADARCTSVELATGLGANPVLVRKLLARLAKDGIVISTSGKNGGVRLARPPALITLLDVYTSVVEQKRFLVTRPNIPAVCVVSRNMEAYFDSVAEEVDARMRETLAAMTIAASLEGIRVIDSSAHVYSVGVERPEVAVQIRET